MVTRNWASASANVAAFVLAACGGGGGTGSTTSSTQNTVTQATSTSQPAASSGDGVGSQSAAKVITLVGSNGDLSKYLGTWKSGCEVRGGFSNVTATVSSPASDPASASPGVPAGTSPSASAGGTSVASTSAPDAAPSIAASQPVSSTGSITFYYGVSTVTFSSVSGNTLAAQSTDKFYEDSDCTKPMSNPYEGTQGLTITYLGNAVLTPNENFSGSADNISINIAGSDKTERGYGGFDPSYRKLYTSASTSFDKDSSSLIKQ